MAASYEDRILRVLAYIHDNPAGDLSLDRLADVAAMSRFHWHRVFRALTGETCAQAVRRIRLHRAAVWLVMGEMPVAQVAACAGYSNQDSFSRAFSDAYGSSPAAFRRDGQVRVGGGVVGADSDVLHGGDPGVGLQEGAQGVLVFNAGLVVADDDPPARLGVGGAVTRGVV